MELFFISDTHFFHANILKFTGKDGHPIRPGFTDWNDMNERMVSNWNKVVTPQDHVYHLGDVTFRYDGAFNNLMSRLNGHKRLIVGNHDKMKNPNLFRWFEKVMLIRDWKDFNFQCTHYPILHENNKRHFNVHGHIHEKLMDDPRYINLCVEHWNYTPVHIDEIRKIIASRS